MNRRPLGASGARIAEIGICAAEVPAREAVLRLTRERGAAVFPFEGASPPGACGLVRYNLLEQTEARGEVPRLRREGKGVVATGVLAGGALAGPVGHTPPGAAVRRLAFLERPGRTLAQAAVQFVLANEAISCAVVRVSSVEHAEEILAAPDAPPLTGADLEQIFELWGNRFE